MPHFHVNSHHHHHQHCYHHYCHALLPVLPTLAPCDLSLPLLSRPSPNTRLCCCGEPLSMLTMVLLHKPHIGIAKQEKSGRRIELPRDASNEDPPTAAAAMTAPTASTDALRDHRKRLKPASVTYIDIYLVAPWHELPLILVRFTASRIGRCSSEADSQPLEASHPRTM